MLRKLTVLGALIALLATPAPAVAPCLRAVSGGQAACPCCVPAAGSCHGTAGPGASSTGCGCALSDHVPADQAVEAAAAAPSAPAIAAVHAAYPERPRVADRVPDRGPSARGLPVWLSCSRMLC